MSSPQLATWTLDAQAQPVVRIGIVLPDDGMRTIRLVIPRQRYILACGGSQTTVESAEAEVFVDGEGVRVTCGQYEAGPGETVTLTPEESLPLERGAGVRARNVLTGRGFHWQKRFHPTLPGKLEMRAVEGRLLLVNELPLEDYLAGVIAGEMGGECPLEFLKSQCIVARSWVLVHSEAKHTGLPIDRCNDDCCQRYHGTTDVTATVLAAVRDTHGQVLVDDARRIIDANYSKSCGGIIESPENVWAVRKSGQRSAVDAPAGSDARRFFPISESNLREYLSGDWLGATDVFCSPTVVPEHDLPRYLGKVDEGGGHFRWRITSDRSDMEAVLRRKFFARDEAAKLLSLGTLMDIRVLHRGDSGRATEIEIVYLDPMGTEGRARIKTEYAIRDALHELFLFSSAFEVEIQRDSSGVPSRITLVGAGWGHGAGLCQIGALGMALKGYHCDAIVHHYFEAIRIHSAY